MKNFIILFEEKEGTSAIVRYLNNFDKVSIVHQINNKGWEPFDKHNRGDISLYNLQRCLKLVYQNSSKNFDKLNSIYTKKSTNPLEKFNLNNGVVGFKMRFRFFGNKKGVLKIPNSYLHFIYNKLIMNIFKKKKVVVFVMVRQDILRWALSKYHGDGTGQQGHLQFKIASGELNKSDLKNISVDCKRLGEIIKQCENSIVKKKKMLIDFKEKGIEAYPLFYEDFLISKNSFFNQLFNILKIKTTEEDISEAISLGGVFEKVHSYNISDFVDNHEEVMELFGNKYLKWE